MFHPEVFGSGQILCGNVASTQWEVLRLASADPNVFVFRNRINFVALRT